MRYFIIFIVLIGLTITPIVIDEISALCLIDSDWPDAPCYGRQSDNPEIDQIKKDWEGYYQYKGEKWMNEQKAILMDFVNNGNLLSYLDHKSEFYTDSNYNVWKYYYLQGQVPQTNGKYLGEFDYPYQQYYEKFFEHSYLVTQCNEGLTLVIKNTKQTPACVKESTGNNLVLRGWGDFAKTANVINAESHILYDIRGGQLADVTLKFDSFENPKSVEFLLVPQAKGLFSARIPSEIINTNPDYWKELIIKVDGISVEPEYYALNSEFKLFSVSFENSTSVIEASLPE
ncbi:MAG: hypothetical protein KGZ34_02755 [Nitrosarchaeum sp.]|nr:hypothetical protein [Nitrosarchaeum sp.]